MKMIMIIPAKARSTRLPGKNIKPFCGMPLVEWSILQGVRAKSIERVVLTTDSDEIAALAMKYEKAEAMFRNYVDDDETPGYVPVKECAARLLVEGTLSEDDAIMCRLCTTPHLLPGDVDGAVAYFQHVRTMYDAKGTGVGAELRTHAISRRVVSGISMQVPMECRCENDYGIVQALAFMGCMTVESLLANRQTPPFTPGYYYKVHPWQMQDVDTPEEWTFAELVMEHYILKGARPEEIYR